MKKEILSKRQRDRMANERKKRRTDESFIDSEDNPRIKIQKKEQIRFPQNNL